MKMDFYFLSLTDIHVYVSCYLFLFCCIYLLYMTFAYIVEIYNFSKSCTKTVFQKHIFFFNCHIVFSIHLTWIDFQIFFLFHDLCFTDNSYIIYLKLFVEDKRRIGGLSVYKTLINIPQPVEV